MNTPVAVFSALNVRPFSVRVAFTRLTLCLALIATIATVANAAAPVVVNTFAGGAADDQGQEIAVDNEGNTYVVGNSKAGWGAGMTSFVGPNAAFVAKFDRDGFLVWNTFLGSGSTTANDIAVDQMGNVYVAGESAATWGAPVRAFTRGGFNGTAKDAFAAKLDPQGNLLWSTFLGGAGEEGGRGVAIASNGDVFVSGTSGANWGLPLRAYTGSTDAFVARLNSQGGLAWNAFLGGTGSESGSSLALDAGSNVYVIGSATSNWGAPISPYTMFDAFVAKVSVDGALLWNTFIGNSASRDMGNSIAADGNGVYVTGSSSAAWGTPVRGFTAGATGTPADAFVVRLNAAGALTWSTFLGGSTDDVGDAIAVDGTGNVHVTGSSVASWGAPGLPFVSGAGSADAFAAQLDGSGALMSNNFVGNVALDFGSGIAVDASGTVHIGGYSAQSWGEPVRPYSGAQDTFVVILGTPDEVEPVLSLPEVITVDGTTAAGADVSFTVSANDDRDGNVAVQCSPASGSFFSNGSTLVNCSASDAAGNTATGSFQVVVVALDTVKPVLSLPADLTANATAAGGANVSFETSANDDRDGAVAVECSPASGSFFTEGSTQVNCSASDAAGNTATGSFLVVVVGDNVKPVLSLPDGVTVNATSRGGAYAGYEASANDDRDGNVPVQCTPASGSFFATGITLVDCSASDAAGNTATGSFEVKVVDGTAPVIESISATPSVLGPPNHKMIPVVVTVKATDSVDTQLSFKITRVTSNEPDNGLGDGDMAGDWKITGPLTLQLRAERSGKGNGRIYTITVEVKDSVGNKSTGEVRVTVKK